MSENKRPPGTMSPEMAEWAERMRGEVQSTAEFSADRRTQTLAQTEEHVARARTERNRIPVDAFKYCFLPFFLGEEVSPEVTQGRPQPDMGHWVSVAGGAYKEVDLVDNAGNVVLTVPPALDSEALDHSIHDKSASMYQGILSSREIYTHSPLAANKHLEHLYSHELKRLIVKPFDIEHIIAWNKIYAYFDKPLIEFPGFDLARLTYDREKAKAQAAGQTTAADNKPAQDQDEGEFEDG